MSTPLVSVIMATYNRSNILGYSIKSVVAQTLTDWELLVVGDCCTDESEAVVSGFHDPRISFLNLPENFGEQSKPNNEGLKRARGQFIAFLNHDDLWFPDHLERCLACLEQTEADMVLSAGFIVKPDAYDYFDVSGVLPADGYHASTLFVPASNWLFRRALIDCVGPWRPAAELYLVPSHDWLKRVTELKKKIVGTEYFTVIALPSSSRVGSYGQRQFQENKWYSEQLTLDPRFRERLLAQRLHKYYGERFFDEKIYLRRFLRKKIRNFLIKLGVNTYDFQHKRIYGKGGILTSYRIIRGLPQKD